MAKETRAQRGERVAGERLKALNSRSVQATRKRAAKRGGELTSLAAAVEAKAEELAEIERATLVADARIIANRAAVALDKFGVRPVSGGDAA